MCPLNLIDATCLVLAAMVVLHSAVHCTPFELGEISFPLVLEQLMEYPSSGPKVKLSQLTLTNVKRIEIGLSWMMNFKRRLSAMVLDGCRNEKRKHCFGVWEFERFVDWWTKLKTIKMGNEAEQPMAAVKVFMDDPTTTQIAQQAMKVFERHEKLMGLLSRFKTMERQGIRNGKEMRKLLIEARSSLKTLHPIHELLDSTSLEIKRILESNESAVVDKFISEEYSWAKHSLN